MSSILSFLRTAVSLLAIVAGALLGIFGLARLGTEPVLGLGYSRVASEWWFTLGLAFFGFTPLVASLAALKSRKRAGLFYLCGAAVVIVCALPDRARDPASFSVAETVSTVLAGFGLFWLVTHIRGWPRVARQRVLPPRAKMAVAGLGSLLWFALVSFAALAISMSWEFPGDCGEVPPFAKQRLGRADFVGRVVHVDRFLGAIAVVEEQFWGVPWHSKVVFLKAPGRPGDQYFVDGRLDNGLLTRYFFPVIDMKCTGSDRLEDAKVELRLLRGSPRWDGVRIIGRVLKLAGGEQSGHPPLPGARVLITGPKGTTIATTDQDGIYDVSGLENGHYAVRADVDDPSEYSSCRDFTEAKELLSGDVWGCTLRVP